MRAVLSSIRPARLFQGGGGVNGEACWGRTSGRDLDGGNGRLYHSQGRFTNEVGHLLKLRAWLWSGTLEGFSKGPVKTLMFKGQSCWHLYMLVPRWVSVIWKSSKLIIFCKRWPSCYYRSPRSKMIFKDVRQLSLPISLILRMYNHRLTLTPNPNWGKATDHWPIDQQDP